MKRKIAAFLCFVMCLYSFAVPTVAVSSRDISEEKACAVTLKQLGLFKGVSDTDFDLERAPTRIEALVMLIRALGKEQEALNGTWRHPFEDVPTWASPYVGYGYVNGLTNGISPTEFGTSDATASIYLTFILRALGYSDANGEDFTWDNPFALAESVGILSDRVDLDNFWRADVAMVSYMALSAKLKGSADTLADKLILAGAFTFEQYSAAMNLDPSDVPTTPTTPTTPTVSGDKLNAEQISEKCSPAVFYVEVSGYNGVAFASGSGFFISENGYAITNLHVLTNSAYITITTVDGKKYDDVKVVDADKESDLALLKVNSADIFTYLEIGDSDAVKQGQTVYAIGSPMGLENTLSQGLVSSPKRTFDETTYIQVSAQIASGSSGGALINEYGKVIGVTTGGIRDNTADLNLAVPINEIKALDKNNTAEIKLRVDSHYPLFKSVCDFGALTGIDAKIVNIIPLGYDIEYDATDVAASYKDTNPIVTCLGLYEKTMRSNGFTVTQVNTSTTKYESETVTVTLKLKGKNKETISLVAEAKIQYYDKGTKVPDFGWYSVLLCSASNEDFDMDTRRWSEVNSTLTHVYEYKCEDDYDQTLLAGACVFYFALLEQEGFEYISERKTNDGQLIVTFADHINRVTCRVDKEYVSIELSSANA